MSPFLDEAGKEEALEAQLQAHRTRRRGGAGGLGLGEEDVGFGRHASYAEPRARSQVEPAHHAYSTNDASDLRFQGRHREEGGGAHAGHPQHQPDRRHAATVATPSAYDPTQLSPRGRRTEHMGPKERMEARKLEEARKREEQLLFARKKYFEERRQAEKKNREMYDHSPILFGNNPKPGRNGSTSPDMDLDDLKTQHLEVSIRIKDLQDRMDSVSFDRTAEADPRARMDLEAEMEHPPQSPGGTQELLPTQSFLRGQVNERVAALRKLCLGNLGRPLFEQVYGLLKARLDGSFGNDDEFVEDVAKILGHHRLHYLGLIDRLIFFEDAGRR